GNDEVARAGAVGAEHEMIEAGAVGGADERGGGGVAEECADGAVAGVDEFRVGVAGEDDALCRHAAADERAGEGERVEVAGAALVDVERGALRAEAEARVDEAGGRGEKVVGRLRAEDEKINART